MKTLEEKKLLVKMAKMLGQPIDQALVESIKREEELNEKLFKIPLKPAALPIQIFKEIVEPLVEAPPAPPAFEPQQVPAPVVPKLPENLKDAELNAIRKTLNDVMQRLKTFSYGGGGGGAVRIHDTDDFDKNSYLEGGYLSWREGMFRLDSVRATNVVNNTTLVTANSYTVLATDYYIGVDTKIYNYIEDDFGNPIVDDQGNPIYESITDNGSATITLPSTATEGRIVIVKDERGEAQNNNIIISGNIDNDPTGVILAINNGAVQLLFRNGWRII
jgi:hypothetical protein